MTSNPQELDIDFVRARFPGLANGWTLFDNAGGTQILESAVERMSDFLFNTNVQTGGSYDLSVKAARALYAGREAMADLVNASRPEEIAFAPCSTVALQNLARSMMSQLSAGDEIVVTVSDHESNIGPWVRLESLGVKIRYWPLDRESLTLRLEDLEPLMSNRTRLVAVTHVSNILGTINPIRDIAKFVHDRGARICVDSVAFAPHRAIDVRELDVDYLVFSLYKVFGPHFAVLYGKFDCFAELDNLYHYFYKKDMIPAKLEPGNASYELAYSSTAIRDYFVELGAHSGASGTQRDRIVSAFSLVTAHEDLIGERLLAYLRSRTDCRIIGVEAGSDGSRVPTISFTIEGHDPARITRGIDDFRIAIRWGDFHARRLAEFLGIDKVNGCVRVSMAHYNTLDEVDSLIEALDTVLANFAA
jgi:cysteine desulfurase family protein (TIGR01976 family)